jgi:hypothetical protein
MLTPIDTVAGVIEAMERSVAAGVGNVWWDQSLDVLREIARE